MASVAALQRDLELAKEGLKSVDENIKKLTGRDPSEFRPAAGRRVMLKRDFQGNTGQGPAAKRRDSAGAQGRLWSRVVTTRTSQDRNRPSSHLDSEGEEEDDDADKPAIQSSVVATPTPSRLKRDIITKTDDKTKSRNKRMFGILLGTLQKFKDDSSQKTEKDLRREEINKKLEEAEKKEKEELSSQRRELFTERRAKQAELRLLQRKVDMAELQEEWDKHGEKLSHFIMTKANPPIFYMPAKHSDKTQKLLEESTRSVKRAMAKRRAEIEEEQEQEEERMRNARLSVSNEGESGFKGGGEGVENATEGDVEMAMEAEKVGEKGRKRSESRDPENGLREERSAREEKKQEDRVERMDEEDGEIPICSSGVRSLGYILAHSVIQCDAGPPQVLQTLLKVLQEGSNDIKVLAAESIKHTARVSSAPLDNALLKVIVPALVTSSKEKNTGVKAAAESALMYVLRLRDGESTLQSCCRIFDASTAESIQDLCRRSLRRLATQEEEVDELETYFSCVDQG